MNERYYYSQWQDPTAERAIGLADRSSRRSSLLPVNGSSVHHRILPPSPQVRIEAEIHTLRTQLAAGVIDSAVYSPRVKSLRSSLRQVKKGGIK